MEAIDLQMLAEPGNRALFNASAQLVGNWAGIQPRAEYPAHRHYSVVNVPSEELYARVFGEDQE